MNDKTPLPPKKAMANSKNFKELVNWIDANMQAYLDANPGRVAQIENEEIEYKEFREKLDQLLNQYGMSIKALDFGEIVITTKYGGKWYEYHALTGH